jgi:hypothetical protein
MAIKSFKELQDYISQIMEANTKPGPPLVSPHHAFWKTMNYEEFTTGNVPGVIDPDTKNPVSILVKGDSANSNLILALKGEGPLFDASRGKFGRMPAGGLPFFTAENITEIAGWIDTGCPE